MTTAQAITMVGLIMGASGLLIGGSMKAKTNMILIWCSVVLWLILSIFMYGMSATPGTGTWDWQFGLFFLTGIITFAVALYSGAEYNKSRREVKNQELLEADEDLSDIIDETDEDERRTLQRQQAIFARRIGEKPRKRKSKADLEYERMLHSTERRY